MTGSFGATASVFISNGLQTSLFFLRLTEKTWSKIPAPERPKAFIEFIKRHYPPAVIDDGWGNLTDASGNMIFVSPLKAGSKPYKAMEQFAMTYYGSSVIKEVLGNPNKYKYFKVLDAKTGSESGFKNEFRLPEVFPKNDGKYPVSNQIIHDLAVIYHEISHAIVFNKQKPDGSDYDITQVDECRAVLKFANPVRMRVNHELRYAYSRDGKTTNVITGEMKIGHFVVSKYDPTVLVSVNDPDRLNPTVGTK